MNPTDPRFLGYAMGAIRDGVSSGPLSPTDKYTAYTILSHYRVTDEKTQRPFMSEETLAREMGKDVRTVRRSILALSKAGILRIEKWKTARGQIANRYVLDGMLNWPKHTGHPCPVYTGHPCPSIPDTSAIHTGHLCPTKYLREVTQVSSKAEEAAAFALEQGPEKEMASGQADATPAPIQHPAHPSLPTTASEELPTPLAPLGSGDTPETFETAWEDFEDRMARRAEGDPSWSDTPTPGFAACLYVHGMRGTFGDEATSKIEQVRKSWRTVLARTEECLEVLSSDGMRVVKYAAWFFAKQRARSEKPNFTLPGWALMLGHPDMVSEFLAVPPKAQSTGPTYYRPSDRPRKVA